jgi:CubicO group peptidase (beta-lactamase class C family)
MGILIRQGVYSLEQPAPIPQGETYHAFPQRELFDKIGVRSMVMETDPYGNFLTQGNELASARDWARLGNLYLQDGIWKGERILPEDFTKFVSTPAKPWVDDGQPIYGGLFWINGDGALPIPKEAYMMKGAGGQSVTIIPSHDLVIVRLGHYKGQQAGDEALNKAYSLLMEAVPEKGTSQISNVLNLEPACPSGHDAPYSSAAKAPPSGVHIILLTLCATFCAICAQWFMQ